eukprot:5077027-Amphidinium_carterae.1
MYTTVHTLDRYDVPDWGAVYSGLESVIVWTKELSQRVVVQIQKVALDGMMRERLAKLKLRHSLLVGTVAWDHDGSAWGLSVLLPAVVGGAR